MNRIFRVVWSKIKNQWQVVSELTSARIKGTSTRKATLNLFLLIFSSNPVLAIENNALPTGGQVTSGTGSISTSGNQMTVSQSSQNMVTSWSSFNIGSDSAVTFNQPNSSATVLNRINDQSPSQILGSLSSNGKVFLINPSGIIFGSSAQVNVGGLVASSLDITDTDFLNGNYHFVGNGVAGNILNQGTITASNGGYIAFLSPVIENSGSITANNGTVAMVAGEKTNLDLTGDGLISYTIDQGAVDAQIQNSGLIQANGGAIILTAKAMNELTSSVVNTTGIVEARGISESNGRIILSSDGGDTLVSGTVDVSSDSSQGGEIIVTGDNISLTSNALLDASGATGGGSIYVGGGWKGSDSSITNATTLDVDKSVTVNASATNDGDGGTIVFWSDDTTMFEGNIIATGGQNSGNGGQVEVSGKQQLGYAGITDTRATNGNIGSLLLDPSTINIKSGAGTNTANDFYEENLEAQLTDITLQTDSSSGNITMEDLADNLLLLQNNVSFTIETYNNGSYTTLDVNDEIRTSGTGSISIHATNSTITTGKLTATGSGLIHVFADDGLTVGNTITTNGGDIELWSDSDDGGAGSMVLNNKISSNGGDIYLDAGSTGIWINETISAGSTGHIYYDTFGSVLNFPIYFNAPVIDADNPPEDDSSSDDNSSSISESARHNALESNSTQPRNFPTNSPMITETGNMTLATSGSLTSEVSSSLTLVSEKEISTVSFEKSNGILTLSTQAGSNEKLVEFVDYLPIFTSEESGQITLEGGYQVNADASSISLTSVSSNSAAELTPTTNAALDRSIRFSLGMDNLTSLELTATVTSDGVLVISGTNTSTQIDTNQIVLMGLKTVRQDLGVKLGEIKSVLLTSRTNRTS